MKINENNSELIGALIGDGYIYRKNRKYQIGFVGHPITDKEYFEYLRGLIRKEWNHNPKINIRERGARMVVDSKEICEFLIGDLNIAHGKGKSERVSIPKEILKNWNLTRRVIRGIVDTDGSVFSVKKPRLSDYPCIELTTNSRVLAKQVNRILLERGFRVSKIWQFMSKLSKHRGYRFGLYGKENLKKWVEQIGFSNPYKLERAISYLNC